MSSPFSSSSSSSSSSSTSSSVDVEWSQYVRDLKKLVRVIPFSNKRSLSFCYSALNSLFSQAKTYEVEAAYARAWIGYYSLIKYWLENVKKHPDFSLCLEREKQKAKQKVEFA